MALKKHRLNRKDWFNQLDVVNCGEFHSAQLTNEVYACPATGGAYSHKRCEYLGLYWGKAVRAVGRIKGVVDVDPLLAAGSEVVLWNNEEPATYSAEQLKAEARQRLEDCFPKAKRAENRRPHRVFVLGDVTETNFEKTSKGGMFTSKIYFDARELQIESAIDLATKLRTKTWADWQR